MYKLCRNTVTNSIISVLLITDDTCTCIPLNPENRDYQEYLKWLAEGNTPEPADE